MNKRMNEARFAEIVAAYGAQARRWPEAERTQALIFARDHAEVADRLLIDALSLDEALDLIPLDIEADEAAEMRALAALMPVQAQNGAQAGNVVPFAARAPRASATRPWVWTGIGLAACIAGAVLGANLSLMSIGELRAQTVLAQVQIIDGDSN